MAILDSTNYSLSQLIVIVDGDVDVCNETEVDQSAPTNAGTDNLGG